MKIGKTQSLKNEGTGNRGSELHVDSWTRRKESKGEKGKNSHWGKEQFCKELLRPLSAGEVKNVKVKGMWEGLGGKDRKRGENARS